ncbi:hypothetical protein EKN35_17475 [Enterobacter asburiae]|uniref:hypothetical protein n=1 Tax=Enterobacter asburiae TaxID=61645 RepID=UPI000F86C86E|nr:hypothetical protein [Enterobacter asburiae]RTP88003.1 hypothetical protein EKN35_17475 [Enterobacter asburiae]
MFKFDMHIDQNYASFYHQESGKAVFVDSFDNQEFDVRVGTLRKSELVATVHASNDDELNQKLNEAASRFLCL